MRSNVPRFIPLLGVASSSIAVLCAWGYFQWRTRKRKKIEADRATTVTNGTMINCESSSIQRRILDRAIRRASKWISYRSSADATPMVGQVGGVSVHKRPILTLEPEYILKPLHLDHRGIREVAFYEAIRAVSQKNTTSQDYLEWLLGKSNNKSKLTNATNSPSNSGAGSGGGNQQLSSGGSAATTSSSNDNHVLDKLATWFAMSIVHDPLIEEERENEANLIRSQKTVKREIEVLRKLANCTPNYYGVFGQKSPVKSAPYGITTDAHLLLQDTTINFSKPCVIDLKMGTQCYEPDAPEDKRKRETAKFPKQFQFGFRIVGMRIYDPNHPNADETGYLRFKKEYGRTLETREQLSETLRIYFSAGCTSSSSSSTDNITDTTSTTTTSSTTTTNTTKEESIRTRSISNLLVQLNMIQRLFDENKSLCFISSSILMVYEGDVSNSNRDVTNIKMIDFGRVRRNAGVGDPGYKLGLRTLRHLMDKLHKDEIGRIRSTTKNNLQ